MMVDDIIYIKLWEVENRLTNCYSLLKLKENIFKVLTIVTNNCLLILDYLKENIDENYFLLDDKGIRKYLLKN
jgi:hypothetical protein